MLIVKDVNTHLSALWCSSQAYRALNPKTQVRILLGLVILPYAPTAPFSSVALPRPSMASYTTTAPGNTPSALLATGAKEQDIVVASQYHNDYIHYTTQIYKRIAGKLPSLFPALKGQQHVARAPEASREPAVQGRANALLILRIAKAK